MDVGRLCAAAVVQAAPLNAEQASIPPPTAFKTRSALKSSGGGGFAADLCQIFVDLGWWFPVTFYGSQALYV